MLSLPRLLTLCRAGGRKNANATSTHVTKRNKSTLFARKSTSSTSGGSHVCHILRAPPNGEALRTVTRLRSLKQPWANMTPTPIPRLCPKQLPGCLGRITAGCLVLYSEVGVWNRTFGEWKSTCHILVAFLGSLSWFIIILI